MHIYILEEKKTSMKYKTFKSFPKCIFKVEKINFNSQLENEVKLFHLLSKKIFLLLFLFFH